MISSVMESADAPTPSNREGGFANENVCTASAGLCPAGPVRSEDGGSRGDIFGT